MSVAGEFGGAHFHLDVTSENDWTRVLDAVASRFGNATILVNNAGKGLVRAVQDAGTEE